MAQLAVTIGLGLLSSLLAPPIKGPRLNDLTVTASTYGNAIPLLYGTCRMGGNVIWSSGIKEHKHKSGKGMQREETYTYTCSFAVAFCVGPTQAVTRLWGDGKLMWGSDPGILNYTEVASVEGGQVDITSQVSTGGIFKTTNSTSIIFRFYNGSEDQLPDGLIVANEGADGTPAFRGLCYIVFEDLDLSNYANRIPSITAEITNVPIGIAPHAEPNYAGFTPSIGTVFCDWNYGCFYMFDGASQSLCTYDLDSHTIISKIPMAYGYGENWCVGPNGGPVYCLDANGNNSHAMWVMSSATGVGYKFGHGSNGLGDSITEDCAEWDPTTDPKFTSDGDIFAFYTMDQLGTQTDYFLHVSDFGGFTIFSGSQPCYLAAAPLGTSIYSGFGTIIPGQVDPVNGTDIVWWANQGEGLIFCIQTVYPGDMGIVQNGFQSDNNCYGAVFSNMAFFTQNTFTVGAVAGYARFDANFMIHDSSDNSLNAVGYFNTAADGSGTSYPGFLKYSVSEQVVSVTNVWTTGLDSSGYDINIGYLNRDSRLQGGKMGWIAWPNNAPSPCAITVDLNSGEIDSFAFNDPDAAYGYMIVMQGRSASGSWDDVTQSFWMYPIDKGPTRYFFRNYGDGTNLAEIVTDLCVRTTALTAEDIDVSQLGDVAITGYVVSNNSSAKDCLTQLSTAYFFDGVESDYLLKFVPRGDDAIVTITEDDLGIVDKEASAGVKETTTQEFELPMRVTVNYYSRERDYQTGSQFAKRNVNPVPTMYSPTLTKTDLPIVMTADQAKQMADKYLKSAWDNRTSLSMTWPQKYMYLDPTDVVNVVNRAGITYRVRIDKFDMGADFTYQVTAVTERTGTYVSTATGDDGAIPPNLASGSPPVKLLVLNTPLLRDQDDTKGSSSLYYVGVTDATSAASNGAQIEDSKTGASFDPVVLVTESAEAGTAINALGGTVSSESTDEHNTLTVRFNNPNFTLETITDDELIANGNPALIGSEVINYREAVQNTDGSWTLSGFLRGRRGTSYAVDTHVIGETFVVLDSSKLETATHDSTDYVSTYAMKAVPPGQLDLNISPTKVNFQPNDLKPYTPENLKATAASGQTTVTFSRRSRITATLQDQVGEVPYFEGQGPGAKLHWQAFFGKTISDATIAAGTATPDIEGDSMIYNADGTWATTQAVFPFDLAAQTTAQGKRPSFVFKVWEVGYVAGFAKIVRFDAPLKIDGTAQDGQYAYTELY